ncbi:MAG: DUF1080 domain-containing protein [Planctomycetota bacterium]|nr:DUF1080 domain-containing protein [Planctomycetota bacterium]
MARNTRVNPNPLHSAVLHSAVLCSIASAVALSLVGCSSSTAPPRPASPSEIASVAAPEKPKPPAFDASIDLEALLAARLSTEELDNGWIRLFDNSTMMGWTPTSKANWSITDGVISASEGEPGFLVTTSRFGDFELQLEYSAASTTNSGVFLRTLSTPKDVQRDCFELNIAPTDNPFPTGSLVGRQRVEPDAIGELDETQWHSMHAMCDGNRIQTWIDGKIAADYQDTSERKSGLIGLQFRSGPIKFRDVRIRPITYAVLPAESLDGWQASNKESETSVPNKSEPVAMTTTRTEDGGIAIKGGKGHIELLQDLGDFALQATILVESPETNTGIFFRCIPGQQMNGYECQVHHGFVDDRRAPKDAGMGAIFRRQNARAVLSDVGQVAHVTVIADGPHLATWVQGVQVVDWTDTRPTKENPREGLRIEPGTIQLQGHDATTEATFQSLNISPIP